ncbi:MAG: hypothetical protein WBD74_06580 [Candidatus Aquilonibacter sp.]
MLSALLLLGVLQMNVEAGQNLTPPAAAAGPWEGQVATGEVAGFSLQITTNADEKVRSLALDTYVRKEGKSTRTWWSSGDSTGVFVLRTGHLQFHQVRSGKAGFDVTLDLIYDPTDMAWKGSFSDPFFAGQVALLRPTFSDSFAPVGTWRTYSQVSIWPTQHVEDYGCLNIGTGQDDALILWGEWHNVFLGNDIKRPSFVNDYGIWYDDSHFERSADGWSFLASTGAGGNRITGALSSDGSSFGGYYSDYDGNGLADRSHPRRTFAWTRMLNLACRP